MAAEWRCEIRTQESVLVQKKNLKLSQKLSKASEVFKKAISKTVEAEIESDSIIDHLEEENKKLRELLGIHHDTASWAAINEAVWESEKLGLTPTSERDSPKEVSGMMSDFNKQWKLN